MRTIKTALVASLFVIGGCADRSVSPWDTTDSGVTPETDSGFTPETDAGTMPTTDSGPAPVEDAGCTTERRYADSDGDGYGEPETYIEVCDNADPDPDFPIVGIDGEVDDCDDTSADVHPGAAEVCGDGIDQNCDGTADEGCPSCVPSPEVCDAVDNDCDGLLNEGGVCPTFPDCGAGEHAEYVTVRVVDDATAELPENLGACAVHWDPYLLTPDWAEGEPGHDIVHWIVWSFEVGWQRYGFRCGTGDWATDLPEGRIASDAGLLVEVFYPDGSSEDLSDETTFVRGADGVRLQVALQRGCTLWGGY